MGLIVITDDRCTVKIPWLSDVQHTDVAWYIILGFISHEIY